MDLFLTSQHLDKRKTAGKINDLVHKGPKRCNNPASKFDKYSSVEFSISNLHYVYQFKIQENSSSGMGVYIKEDSVVLKHLRVGDIFEMKYYADTLSEEAEYLKTEIRYITKERQGRFRGHYLVDLSIIENEIMNP
jgi:hypothetical protein